MQCKRDKHLLDLSSEEIGEKFSISWCRSTAHSIIIYLCGQQEKLVQNPNQGRPFANLASEQEDKKLRDFLFSDKMDTSVFLIEMGSNFHTFVIEKVLDENTTPKCIIYQSWDHQFDLSWWLGGKNYYAEDQAPWNRYLEPHFIELRDKFGKGKKLNKADLEEFLSILIKKIAKDEKKYHNLGVVGEYSLIKPRALSNSSIITNTITHSNQLANSQSTFFSDVMVIENTVADPTAKSIKDQIF